MKRKHDSNVKCSFCGKSPIQVKKLIAGPSVYICDKCVDICNETLDEELLKINVQNKDFAKREHTKVYKCSYCSNEEKSISDPYKCSICDNLKFILIENIHINKVTYPNQDGNL